MHFYFQNKHKSKMVDNPIHHGGYFNPPWWILEFTKFTCFILLICIFIFQQTQKQDGGYLNPQNKWNVGSDAFIIAQNINHNRERGYFLKPFYTFYTLTIQSESKPRWRLSTVSNLLNKSSFWCIIKIVLKPQIYIMERSLLEKIDSFN